MTMTRPRWPPARRASAQREPASPAPTIRTVPSRASMSRRLAAGLGVDDDDGRHRTRAREVEGAGIVAPAHAGGGDAVSTELDEIRRKIGAGAESGTETAIDGDKERGHDANS